jgi:hypothetical protein
MVIDYQPNSPLAKKSSNTPRNISTGSEAFDVIAEII